MLPAHHRALSLFLVAATSLAGCGTLSTRGHLQPVVGAYPLQGTALDLAGLYAGFTDPVLWHPEHDRAAKVSKEGEVIGLLLSLPADLVIDVVLLPVDLVAWPFGWQKTVSR